MPKQLPARPNLEHLRTQAKSLLAEWRAGLTLEQIEKGPRLADAQLAIARKTGFAAWPSLARHVETLRSMEGTWAFRSLEIDGSALPPVTHSSSRLLIDGDRFRMESPEAVYEGLFTIDVGASPHRIDIDFYEGPEAGNRSEGLFELDGDSFRICLGLTGAPRPAAFVTSPGSGHALELLVRTGHIRPPAVDGGTPPPPAGPVTPAPPADATAFDGPITPPLDKLQGSWVPLELVDSGMPLQSAYLSYGSRTHNGAEAKVVFGGQTMLHVRMRFDTGVRPIQVDYLSLSGKTAGAISKGIFKWEGDQAVFCIGPAGGDRPSAFTSAPGSKNLLSRWKPKP